MKKTTCRGLKGACDEVITGENAEEMGENSKQHVMKMMQAGDKDHQDAVNNMMELSKEDQEKWHEDVVKGFDSLKDA